MGHPEFGRMGWNESKKEREHKAEAKGAI